MSSWVEFRGISKGAAERLKDGFHRMVWVLGAFDADMERNCGSVGKTLKKDVGQIQHAIPRSLLGQGVAIHEDRTTRKIHKYPCQRLIHGKNEAPVPADAPFVPQGRSKCVAEGAGDILDGVVIIHMKVSHGFHFQIEQSLLGNVMQHVIQKANARGDTRDPCPIERQGYLYLGLCRSSGYLR
jgi:hypothetical protein